MIVTGGDLVAAIFDTSAPPIRTPSRYTTNVGIDPYAALDQQSTVDPEPKPGVVAFREHVLSRFPSTGDGGISRPGDRGGRSEHKEGRAWDWLVYAPDQLDLAEALFDELFASDVLGNRHALARRWGIMYIIFNRAIWGSYLADEGWRPYSGPNPHTDHVHFSFSWAGAMKQTSLWRESVAA